ncbi:histidine kinase [Solirubrobacter pauli]|uniref:histidine kinase n=1 Tax=Solirubrobacter pauli TaxID=166793 RepID=A0A660L5L1_9ACTN|nr:histidine kinase [Solirubrobacter pauli]RKQ86870.1 histidine kinase [Solirubrobacter pauli]
MPAARRVPTLVRRLAGAVRPQHRSDEIATLRRSFTTMERSLEASRDELRLLAAEQAALRRVATLVARGVPADELFDAVTDEVCELLDADETQLLRYERDGTTRVVGPGDDPAATEARRMAARVRLGGRPVRSGSHADRCSVAAPVAIEDRLWGAMVATWAHGGTSTVDVEARMAQFTDLVATAIANAESRSALAASRARAVATADETRRRIERDLHDGAQQRLTHTVITLKFALAALDDHAPAAELVREALEHAERATSELRDLAHGILPAALRSGGLDAGIETLVARLRLRVTVDVTRRRFSPALEATAYFIVAEALTNTVKYADASSARVWAHVRGEVLHVRVSDDGVGGARVAGSSGLLGLQDRAAALDGTLRVTSPPGGGTVVEATLPRTGPA